MTITSGMTYRYECGHEIHYPHCVPGKHGNVAIARGVCGVCWKESRSNKEVHYGQS